MSWRKRVGHGSSGREGKGEGGQRKWTPSPEGRERPGQQDDDGEQTFAAHLVLKMRGKVTHPIWSSHT